MINARRKFGIRFIGVMLAAACALAFGLVGPAAAETFAAGTDVYATLTSSDINTKNAQVGDPFTMAVVPPYPGGDYSFAHARIRGHVAAVRRAGQGRKPELRLAFDRIIFAGGRSEPISGSIVKLQTQQENTTARKALGAGAGMAVGSQTIGRVLGGALGGVVGILGGAVGGYLYGANNKANFNVATGSRATINMTSPLEVPRRQASS
jgi:hypothetical protein